MEWINTILVAIGLILFGWYQHYKIKNLQNQIKSQGEILSKVKIYVDLYDPKQFKEMLKLHEEKHKMKLDIEIEKIKAETSKKIKSTKEGFKNLLKFYGYSLEIIFNLIPYIPVWQRGLILSSIKDSPVKESVAENLNKMPYLGDELRKTLVHVVENYSASEFHDHVKPINGGSF